MAGRYKPYPEYKDSHGEWVGMVPCDWVLMQAKFCFLLQRGHDLSSDQMIEGEYPVYGSNGPIGTHNAFTTKAPSITVGRSGSVGEVNYVEKDFWAHNTSLYVKNFIDSSPRFIYYLLLAINPKRLSAGSVVGTLDRNNIHSQTVAVPSVFEKNNIANFLDYHTAKIDTLIEKQQQLIQLLKEKRQAVISHAVTKGLNPNTKMRDSGVEWLGEVPEHWEVSKFGYISMVVRGGSPRPAGDPTLFNGDYSPWVTVAEITKDDEVYLTQTETFLTKKGSNQCRVFSSGTLLISNSGATLGVPKILSIDANANDGVVGFENLKLDHEFSYFYLSTLTNDLRERVKQGSGQPNLNTDIVKNIVVPIPPKNEVSEIVALIRNTRKQYASLMARATAGIELLQERRTALITAAVTGKIDVRNWVAPKESKTNKEVAA